VAAGPDKAPVAAAEGALASAERALSRGQLEQAETLLRGVLAAEPDCAEAMWGMGRIALSVGEAALARDYLERAIARCPDRPEYHDVLAGALLALGEAPGAEASSRRAVSMDPSRAGFQCRLGESLRAQERWDDAARAFRVALERDPCHFRSHTGLGNLERDLLHLGAAERSYLDALQSKPESALARWNLGLLYLFRGEFARGWDGYAAGVEAGQRPRRPFAFPVWDGRAPFQGTLLVYAEQGLGDEIMFASCVPDLVARNVRCVLECDPRLGTLFERALRGVSVWPVERDNAGALSVLGNVTAQMAAGDLPRLLRRERTAFPRRVGYLHADAGRVERWRRVLSAQCAGLRVGISWRGGARAADRRARSVPHASWRRLAEVPGVTLIAAQYDGNDDDRERFRQAGVDMLWPDEIDGRTDIEEFSALVAALDLLVCVDNSTAHLCGAIGQRGWVLLPQAPDWRWMATGDDSPWYPSLRLFRRDRQRGWDAVLHEAAAAMEKLSRLPTTR